MGRALDETSFAAPAVLWLGDPRSTEAGLVGGKAAQLSALAATHPVPEAFCVTTAAYAAYERTGGVPPDVARGGGGGVPRARRALGRRSRAGDAGRGEVVGRRRGRHRLLLRRAARHLPERHGRGRRARRRGGRVALGARRGRARVPARPGPRRRARGR